MPPATAVEVVPVSADHFGITPDGLLRREHQKP